MKIKLIPSINAPEYDISGNVITATHNDEVEVIDLSEFPQNGKWQGGELENITKLSPSNVICDVFHDGELHVKLCQKVPVAFTTKHGDKEIKHQTGDWVESDWIDADDYEKEKLYIKEVGNEN